MFLLTLAHLGFLKIMGEWVFQGFDLKKKAINGRFKYLHSGKLLLHNYITIEHHF